PGRSSGAGGAPGATHGAPLQVLTSADSSTRRGELSPATEQPRYPSAAPRRPLCRLRALDREAVGGEGEADAIETGERAAFLGCEAARGERRLGGGEEARAEFGLDIEPRQHGFDVAHAASASAA